MLLGKSKAPINLTQPSQEMVKEDGLELNDTCRLEK